MPDAGYGGPDPVDRRYDNPDFIACYDNLTAWAKTMDRLGYDTMWLTEHHFQYEGYEVTPNLILFGLHLARRQSAYASDKRSTSFRNGILFVSQKMLR